MYTVRIVLGIVLTLVLAVLLSADRRPTAGGAALVLYSRPATTRCRPEIFLEPSWS